MSSTLQSIQGSTKTEKKKSLKGACPIFQLFFFQTFWDVGITRKLICCLYPITNFVTEKMFHLEDINENVSGYGNHIKRTE